MAAVVPPVVALPAVVVLSKATTAVADPAALDLYRKKKRIRDERGEVKKLKEMGKKRKLARRCPSIVRCVEQIRLFRRHCMENAISMTNLNSTYVLHGRFERAEVLQPGFASSCDARKLGSADAHEEAKQIIASKDTDSMKRRLALGRAVRAEAKANPPKSAPPPPPRKQEEGKGIKTLALPLPPLPPPPAIVAAVAGQWSAATCSPLHPVTWNQHNLCFLRATNQLGATLTLHHLKKIFMGLHIAMPATAPKAQYVNQLSAYLDECTCRRHHRMPPMVPSALPFPPLPAAVSSFSASSSRPPR